MMPRVCRLASGIVLNNIRNRMVDRTYMLIWDFGFPVLVFHYLSKEHAQLHVFNEKLCCRVWILEIIESQRTQVEITEFQGRGSSKSRCLNLVFDLRIIVSIICALELRRLTKRNHIMRRIPPGLDIFA